MKRRIESTNCLTLRLDCWHSIKSQKIVGIGDETECLQCDFLEFPAGLEGYKKTPVFNQETIPKGFRRAHSTKKGVWAIIHVLSGKVRYMVDDLSDQSFDLDQHTQGVIAPQMEHHLEVIGDVELYVEFYTKQKT